MSQEVTTLVVKIDKDLHRKMKATCVANDISIKNYIVGLIKKDMEQNQDGNIK